MAITIDELKRNVFPGESGGDYNALFGYANRPGGQFAGTNLTDMTVDQALQFASPSGPYGQSVKGQIGRVATPMGAWQVVGTTLNAAKQGLGLTGSEKMTPELQDAIGMWIYQAQGPGAWEGWGKKGAGGGGSASAAAASAPNTGMMPMGLLDMQDEPQTFAERLKSQWQSGELKDRIALAANTLRMNPDQNLASALQDRQQAREQKSTMNRTAQWLISQGREDLAQAMLTGAVDPKSAVAVAMQPADPLRDLQVKKAEIELAQLEAGSSQDPNVQASQALPDQSGVVLTLRDGTVQVRTVGGDLLTGQPALDFVRSAQENAAEYQRSVYGARREGTLGADIGMGEAASAAGARGAEIGKAQGIAAASAPVDIASADTALEYIGEVRSHPGLDLGTGASSVANVVPGTVGYDFQSRVNQLLSGGFLTAIDQMRGMGALSNAEGQTATRAISRMDTATSKEEFLAALDDYENIVKLGRERAAARVKAQETPPSTQQQAPAAAPRLRYNPETRAFE